MTLIVLFVIFGIPFCLYIVWGSLLIDADEVSDHIGYGIMFLLFAAHCFFLGMSNWFSRSWRITTYNL
jgi:hypothetical protein